MLEYFDNILIDQSKVCIYAAPGPFGECIKQKIFQ